MKTFTLLNSVSENLLILMLFLITTPSTAQVKHIIQVTDYQFAPSELTISVGDTVEWQNTQGYHNVNATQATYPTNPESFGNSLGNGWTFSHVFNISGDYDYRCDAHYSLGMVGKVIVQENTQTTFDLTVNFSAMNPHVGETLWLAVIDKDSGVEIDRIKKTADVDFSVTISGIEKDHSYWVNFFADHNKNGMYDAPPTDHAWQLELNKITGNSVLNFTHNTNFTDIMWKNKLTVHFMNMTPHVGEDFHLAVIDKNSGMEVQRVTTTADVDFMVDVYGIENGMSYNVDFFADHNKNRMYDTPPADHAWRLELNDVMGDTTLTFTHNTSFTDIKWKNKLTVHFMNMTPHVGEDFHLAVYDKVSGTEIQKVDTVADVNFTLFVYGIVNGMSYNVDFYADHNRNGMYDSPPTDHAWRLELNDVMGDTTLTFTHNTNFTDIGTTTGLTDDFQPGIKIYPNPARDKIMIETGTFNSVDIQVKIYDISGKLKLSQLYSPRQDPEIDIRQLVNGMYFVEISRKNKSEMLKLIKY